MVTKTIGPLHFEDLEPHRFEDLVRNLLYDFRDWQTIEPTGRGGADDGYDARGWERMPAADIEEDELVDDETVTGVRRDARVWMIQCKREKKIGPADVRRIIVETVDPNDPPYGYILAASVDLSKKSHDAFRDELRTRGVFEFYVWGKAEIEDMLLMPKNDRILFAFMGISLATRRRSRTTEVRAAVTVKNKLLRSLDAGGFGGDLLRPILVRDINDVDYPFKEHVSNFARRPRWEEHIVTEIHPLGLLVDAKKHCAYVDREAKEYDIVEGWDMVRRESDPREHDSEVYERRSRIHDYHEHLPMRHRGIYFYRGLIRFSDVLLVDDKGDPSHAFPHVFVDMELGNGVEERFGPFNGHLMLIEVGKNEWVNVGADEYKRIQRFPKEFASAPTHNKIVDRQIEIDPREQWGLESDGIVLYDIDGRYQSLSVRDAIQVSNPIQRIKEKPWVEVIETRMITAEEYRALIEAQRTSHVLGPAELQEHSGDDPVPTIEVRSIYEFSIKD